MKKYTEAINICLQAIGEQTIDETTIIEGHYEIEQADFLIEQVKNEVLAMGFTFNEETNWPLTPNTDGYIVIPTNILSIDGVTEDVIRKDGKLYDKTNKTYIFSNTVLCDVTWSFDFDDIPPVFQRYIALKAARMLYQRLVAGDLIQVLIKDEEDALLICRQHEDDVGDYNIFDDQSVSRALTRTSNPTGLRG